MISFRSCYPHPVIPEVQLEQSRPRQEEARELIEKIVALVTPIMERRRWKVGILAEFSPDAEDHWTLWGKNKNRGEIIFLRLRDFKDERHFLPLKLIVDVMLHELSHNSQPKHDAPFYALWNELRNESNLPFLRGYTNKDPYLTRECGKSVVDYEAETRSPDTQISPTREVENDKPVSNRKRLPWTQTLALRHLHPLPPRRQSLRRRQRHGTVSVWRSPLENRFRRMKAGSRQWLPKGKFQAKSLDEIDERG